MEGLSDDCSVSDVCGVETRARFEDESSEVAACGVDVDSVVSMSDESASFAESFSLSVF